MSRVSPDVDDLEDGRLEELDESASAVESSADVPQSFLPLPRAVTGAAAAALHPFQLPASQRSESAAVGVVAGDEPASPTQPDRIGAYFGVGAGNETTVPKAAYEAMLHRVRTLETALGVANREVRAGAAQAAELRASVAHLNQQLQHKELLVRQAIEYEAALAARESELEARERALEVASAAAAASRQRRVPPQRKRGGPAEGDSCPHCGGAVPDVFVGFSVGGPSPSSFDGVVSRRRSGLGATPPDAGGRTGLLPQLPPRSFSSMGYHQ